MAINSHAVNRIASRGLRFFFAPQLFSGLKPSRSILVGFIQLIAQILGTAGLIPATHRSMHPVDVRDARLGEVLALAYANARRPGTRLDQWSVLLAVTGLMALVTIILFHMILTLLMGTAHAAITPFILGPAACTYINGQSLFTPACATDMAQQWIDVLLLGASYWWSPQATFMSVELQNGMAAMFQTYSMAMLVLAGFLVLYHLLIIIAGTAHEGKFGGRGMNQIWAPVRLVAAIGMLVPLGVNGLNSGQMIVTQVAKWGSGLASNVWLQFANTYGATGGAVLIMPNLPQVSPVVRKALDILVCQHAYRTIANMELGNEYTLEVVGWNNLSTDSSRVVKTWDYRKTLDQANGRIDTEKAVCGSINLPDPVTIPSGTIYSFLTNNPVASIASQYTYRTAMMLAHQRAIDNLIADGSPLSELAKAIWDSSDSANSRYRLTSDDLLKFNEAVADYRNTLRTGAVAATIAAAFLGGGMSGMSVDAMARGWVSAGVWFNTVARTNAFMMAYMKDLPVVTPDFKTVVEVGARAKTALEIAAAGVGDLPALASTMQVNFAEPNFLVATGGMGTGGSTLDAFMLMLDQDFDSVMGSTTASEDEITNGLPAFVSAFQLNTAHPLAELSALGNRLIDASTNLTKRISNCQATAAEEARHLQAVRQSGDAYAISDLTGGKWRSACGDAAYGQIGPAYFIMSAAIGSLLAAGVTLAFLLPLIPFIRFMFGIMTWILALFETVIAIPVVALAHIKTDGEGLAGPMARTAYLLMLQLFLRPTLMIFGLILALVVFNLMILALNEFYVQAMMGARESGSSLALSKVVYTVIYMSLAYAFANASFKAIDLVPSQCLQWIGGSPTSSQTDVETVTRAVGTTTSIGGQAGTMIGRQGAYSGMIGRL